jgi:two-component system, OmpR family, response regulator
MMSAIATSTDRVEGMHAGCNDYLAKAIRIRRGAGAPGGAWAARGQGTRAHVLRVADLELDTQARLASCGGQVIRPQDREPVRIAPSAPAAGTEAVTSSRGWKSSSRPANPVLVARHPLRSAVRRFPREANPMPCRRAYNILQRPNVACTKIADESRA